MLYTTIEDLNVSDALQHILRTDTTARRTLRNWLATLEPNCPQARQWQPGARGRCLACGAKQADHILGARCPSKHQGADINRILRARPRDMTRGAPMGAVNRDERTGNARVYCQRVRFIDGDYGADGTYWGAGSEPLWAVFTADLALLWYVRAQDRRAAAWTYMQENPRAGEYGRPKA